MPVADLLIASIKCVQQLGIPDTFRATLNRNRTGIARSLVGAEAQFRVSKSDPRKVRLRTGTTDWVVFNQIFVRREYDLTRFPQWSSIMRHYEAMLRAGQVPTIIDCGANVGLAAVWFSLQFPKARIIAIEMEKNNFIQLEKNIVEFPAIEAINTAIWGEVTTVSMKTMDAESHAFSAEATIAPDARTNQMTSTTINDLVQRLNIDALLCVKIDIEGGEASVFSHATQWMDNVKVIFVELHDSDRPGLGCGKAMVEALSGRNFDILISGELIVAVMG
jgi:FkbM family methyltransferase